jgi:hypothetical protein
MKTLSQGLAWNDLEIGDLMQMQRYYRENFNLHKHTLAKDVREVVGPEVWDNYFKFTFVRHPYSRSLSLYTYIKKMLSRRSNNVLFRTFLIKYLKGNDPIWQWPLTKAYIGSKNFSEFIRHEQYMNYFGAKPQVSWIFDQDGQLLVDFVGKIENLEDDFQKAVKKIGIESTLQLKVTNTSQTQTKPGAYFKDEADYQHLARIYQQDFLTFGYDPGFRF